jgi:hypothetical protein
MIIEINLINRILPNIPANEKTSVIKGWISSDVHKIEHYKGEQRKLLKEATIIFELALWKAKND